MMNKIWLQNDEWNLITKIRMKFESKWWIKFDCKMMNEIWLQNDEWNLITKIWMKFDNKWWMKFDNK